MDIFAQFHQHIERTIRSLWPDVEAPFSFSVEAPHNPDHGDVATNAPLVLAKKLRQPPPAVGKALTEALENHPWIESISLAGPGFVNVVFKPHVWVEALNALWQQQACYGHTPQDPQRIVNIEYVSANPTGPMHIGHARGAAVGDALARILKATGHMVIKEYYINDAGGQADQLARSVYHRYCEALGRDMGACPAGAYPGEYLIPVGQKAAQTFGPQYLDAPEDVWRVVMREYGVQAMIELIRDDLQALGIHHDIWTSERAIELSGLVDQTIARLDQMGSLYEGVLEPPKGQTIEDWEPRPQTLFRATDFGDDCDRPLKKSDGQWTYFARDIAYHYDKWKRSGGELINFWGADHAGYVKRLQSALSLVTEGQAHLDVRLCHIVTFMKDGEVLKMSKRLGTFTTVRDLMDQVGADVIRFLMVSRKEGAPLEFDLDVVLSQTKDNPVFYIQYAYARIHSVERQAQQMMPQVMQDLSAMKHVDLSLLTGASEKEIIQYLAQWPRVLHLTASAREPHRIAFYLLHLATLFHALWNQGKEQAAMRFILEQHPDITLARLMLNRMVGWTLENGMNLLGISLKKEM